MRLSIQTSPVAPEPGNRIFLVKKVSETIYLTGFQQELAGADRSWQELAGMSLT
ncbi:hypothetical protein RSJ42_01930 [Methanosarcina hadiensis]|uniref:hypothetical protein n=1 Tax=Methanosarcina hadiensis TaxID=3078083 RepID=UPI003977C3A0